MGEVVAWGGGIRGRERVIMSIGCLHELDGQKGVQYASSIPTEQSTSPFQRVW